MTKAWRPRWTISGSPSVCWSASQKIQARPSVLAAVTYDSLQGVQSRCITRGIARRTRPALDYKGSGRERVGGRACPAPPRELGLPTHVADRHDVRMGGGVGR